MADASTPEVAATRPGLRSLFSEHGYILGPLGAALAWFAILWSANVNPWWSWTSSALSYLGAPNATDPWIYNYVGMVPTGLLLVLFSVWLTVIARNRIESLGGLFFLLGGVCLILVGVFPQGGGHENFHVLSAAAFFLFALLSVLAWGIGLRREGRRPLGHLMIALAVGTVAFALVLFRVNNNDIPGAEGEVLGVLAIDLWVLLLNFARVDYPNGQLRDWERPHLTVRPSVVHALQPRALLYAGAGLLLFGFGYYYFTSHVAAVVGNWEGVGSILALAVVTLTAYFLGYFLVVLAAWRWRRALYPGVGGILFLLTAVPPILMAFSWFNLVGVQIMLVYLLSVGTLLPLGLSLRRWRRSEYAITNQRVLSWERDPRAVSREIALPRARSVSVEQEGLDARLDIGNITFYQDAFDASGAGPNHTVTWEGVHHPHWVLSEIRESLGANVISSRRRGSARQTVALCLAIGIPLILVLTFVPVFSATTTTNVPCWDYLSFLHQYNTTTGKFEQGFDPWPYLHNVTLPPAEANYRWTSGAPVFVLILEVPPAEIIESTPISSISPGNFTTSGSGPIPTYGGAVSMLCVSIVQGTTVTAQYTYAAPLVWD